MARPDDPGRFTVGVFQDVEWARRGIAALLRDGFAAESITILAKESPDVPPLIEALLGAPPDRVELKALGAGFGRGPLVRALQADGGGNAAIGAWTGRV